MARATVAPNGHRLTRLNVCLPHHHAVVGKRSGDHDECHWQDDNDPLDPHEGLTVTASHAVQRGGVGAVTACRTDGSFADSEADALRTAIAKACRAAAIPIWSPHDLRHRWVSLLHLQGQPWARIGEWVGQRNLSVTADTYIHVLTDETELDYERLLSGLSRVSSC
jgi:hypothetical protein